MVSQAARTTEPSVRATKKSSLLNRLSSGPWPWLLPALLILVIFRLYPIISQFYIAMTDMRITSLTDFDFVGFQNYEFVLQDRFFLESLGFTFVYTIFGVLGQWIVGFGLAILMDQPLKGRTFFRIGIMSSWVISSLIVGYMWRVMLSEGSAGVINSWLNVIGIANVEWLSDIDNARFSVIMVNVWRSAAYTMVFMLAGLQTVPKDLLEAATVDGANVWQRLVRVKIPFMRQLIAINIIFITIATFNVYEQVFILTKGGPGRATETIGLRMYETAFGDFSSGGLGLIGRAAAMGNIMFFITLAFAIAYLWLTLLRQEDET